MQSTTFDNLAGDDCLLSLVNAICDKNMKPSDFRSLHRDKGQLITGVSR